MTVRRTPSPRLALVAFVAGLALAGCGSSSGASAAPGTTGTAAQLVQAGLAATTSGNDDAAVAAFRGSVTKDAGNLLAHYNLGVIYQKRGLASAALSEYAAALATNPKYVPALYNSATLLAVTNPALAAVTYQQVLALQPKNAAANLNLGLLEVQLKQPDAARQHLATAVALDPKLLPRVPAAYRPKGTEATPPAAAPSPK